MPNDEHEERVGAENYILVGVCFVLGLVAIAAGSLVAYRHYVKPPRPADVAAPAAVPPPVVGNNRNVVPPAAPRGPREPFRRRKAPPAGTPEPELPAGWSLNHPEFQFVTAWPLPPRPNDIRCSLANYRVATTDTSTVYLLKQGDTTYEMCYVDFDEVAGNIGEFIELNVPPFHRAALRRILGEGAATPNLPWLKDRLEDPTERFLTGTSRPGFRLYAAALVAGRRLFVCHVECPDRGEDLPPDVLLFMESFRIP